MSKCCIVKSVNIVSGSGSLTTIYSGNASLTGNRTVTGGGNNLTFDMGAATFTVSGVITTKGENLPAQVSNPGGADTLWVSGINPFIGAEPIGLLPVASEVTGTSTARLNYLTPVNVLSATAEILPPVPAGLNSRFEVVDSRANSPTNNILINFTGAGQKFYGSLTENYTINTSGGFARFRYLGSTIGWVVEK